MLKIITLSDVEIMAHRYAQSKLAYDEPIPDFSTRYPNRLESCLITPFQAFGKEHLYKGLIAKAAILFYLMNKNHPFQNGNKRIAMTTLLAFLYLNGKWMVGEMDEVYPIAKKCAQQIANAKFVSLPGLDHGGAIRRSEEILPHINTFLAAVSRGTDEA